MKRKINNGIIDIESIMRSSLRHYNAKNIIITEDAVFEERRRIEDYISGIWVPEMLRIIKSNGSCKITEEVVIHAHDKVKI